MDLDKEYGPALRYQGTVTSAELSCTPMSLQKLSEAAEALKSYIENAEQLLLTSVIHSTAPILWLIDAEGELRFAVEEVLDGVDGATTYILPRRGPPMRAGDVRLGHPALLEQGDEASKVARIGGEIRFDPKRNEDRHWVMTNNSGRFGKRAHTKPEHLENANGLFADVGISFRTFFIYSTANAGVQK